MNAFYAEVLLNILYYVLDIQYRSYNQVQALTVSLASELSIAFRVLMKHVCSLTTYSQVISITCKCNCSIHFLLESTSRVECESCMQANLMKSLYLAFCYCNLFLQLLFSNFCNCYYFIVFMLYTAY